MNIKQPRASSLGTIKVAFCSLNAWASGQCVCGGRSVIEDRYSDGHSHPGLDLHLDDRDLRTGQTLASAGLNTASRLSPAHSMTWVISPRFLGYSVHTAHPLL